MILTELGTDPGAQGIMWHKEGFAVSEGKSPALCGKAGIWFSWTQRLQEPQLGCAQHKQLLRRDVHSTNSSSKGSPVSVTNVLHSSCHPGAAIPLLKGMADWQGLEINSPPASSALCERSQTLGILLRAGQGFDDANCQNLFISP